MTGSANAGDPIQGSSPTGASLLSSAGCGSAAFIGLRSSVGEGCSGAQNTTMVATTAAIHRLAMCDRYTGPP